VRELFDKCLSGPWTVSGDDVHYKLTREADRLTLVFSPTWNKHGWRHNFDFAAQMYKDSSTVMLVHKGFKEMYHSVRDEITGRIKDEIAAGVRYLVCLGYSQGGALAVLAHEDACFQFTGLDVYTVSFGAPKVIFAPSEYIRSRFIGLSRYVVQGDPVPMIPPWFSHVGNRVLVGPPSLLWPWNHKPEAYLRSLP
jgi:hypothetical protein